MKDRITISISGNELYKTLKSDFNQQQAARAVNMKPATFAKHLHTQDFTLDQLSEIAQATAISVSELLWFAPETTGHRLVTLNPERAIVRCDYDVIDQAVKATGISKVAEELLVSVSTIRRKLKRHISFSVYHLDRISQITKVDATVLVKEIVPRSRRIH